MDRVRLGKRYYAVSVSKSWHRGYQLPHNDLGVSTILRQIQQLLEIPEFHEVEGVHEIHGVRDRSQTLTDASDR